MRTGYHLRISEYQSHWKGARCAPYDIEIDYPLKRSNNSVIPTFENGAKPCAGSQAPASRDGKRISSAMVGKLYTSM